MEKMSIREIVSIIFKAVTLAMGVAVEYVSCEPSESLKGLFPEEYGEDDFFEKEETEQA